MIGMLKNRFKYSRECSRLSRRWRVVLFVDLAMAPFVAGGAPLPAPSPVPLTLPALTVAPQGRTQRLANIGEGVRQSLRSLVRIMNRVNPTPSIRDLPNGALAALALGEDPGVAEKLLRAEFAQQNMDPASAQFGDIPWQIGHPEVKDANSIEFGFQAVGPILLHFRDRLTPAFIQEATTHVRAAFVSIRRHKVKASYTNIYLMKTVNLTLMGESVGDTVAADQGYAQLDTWMQYTRDAGIHEFDSPTYYATDLNSLILGYRYAARPGAREKFKRILDYFWTDIATNLLSSRGILSGPHSRDYDFLNGTGGLNLYLYLEGLRQAESTSKVDLEKAAMLDAGGEDGYHPSTSVLEPAIQPERVIIQKWDLEPGLDRYNYITPDFAVGSANGDYGPQDKLVTVDFNAEVPTVAIVPDTYDAPYGKLKIKDRSGHNKPHHLPLHPVCVRSNGALLVLLDLDPHKEPLPDSLATNILLPVAASTIVMDGTVIKGDKVFNIPAGPTSVVGVRVGAAGVGVRLFRADGCAGQQPAFALKSDADGLKWGAMRFVVYHYRGLSALAQEAQANRPIAHAGVAPAQGSPPTKDVVQTLSETHVRVGVLIVAAPCPTDRDLTTLVNMVRDARPVEAMENGEWKVDVHLAGVTLAAVSDMKSRKPIHRLVNGKEMPDGIMSLNGAELVKW